VIEATYAEMDAVVGRVMPSLDDRTTLIIMSDHGFGPFYKSFDLNTWLFKNGYLALKGMAQKGSLFKNIDWGRTRAYALGLNALYLNLRGRERDGIVAPGAEREDLLREIAGRLEAVKDPENGHAVVKRVYRTDKEYSGDYVSKAPDLIVGYDWGYRTSWESALGDVTGVLLKVSTEKWSGDHCGAMEIVPGILFSNKKIALKDPHLYDLTPTILGEFGIQKPADMIGKNIFAAEQALPREQ
jgi:predicted AlkP superfamily phosphohydrolase/phosphomutase